MKKLWFKKKIEIISVLYLFLSKIILFLFDPKHTNKQRIKPAVDAHTWVLAETKVRSCGDIITQRLAVIFQKSLLQSASCALEVL